MLNRQGRNNLIAFQSKRYWLPYFPEDANSIEGPYAIRLNQYKAHYYTKG